MAEIIISAVAAVAILAIGIKYSAAGLFRSLARALFAGFALLAAMRFWFPAVAWLSQRSGLDPAQLSFGCFWVLFAAVYMPLHILLDSLNEELIPVYPAGFERVGGFFFSTVFGAAVVFALFLSLLAYLPVLLPSYDGSRMLLPMERGPLALYRSLEHGVAGMPDGSPAQTKFPIVQNETPIRVEWR